MFIWFLRARKQLSHIRYGQIIQLSCDSCDRFIAAQVSYVSSQAEYTPPVLFSERERRKLVYRVEAKFSEADAMQLHPGQPVDVYLHNRS
ncbi:MAG: hypothetical protein HWD59_09710 [Coxiellaceae bacterium]|nr:MAG: hypothetical protein HWD59_09710 [Coxiellaceae bacterium]